MKLKKNLAILATVLTLVSSPAFAMPLFNAEGALGLTIGADENRLTWVVHRDSVDANLYYLKGMSRFQRNGISADDFGFTYSVDAHGPKLDVHYRARWTRMNKAELEAKLRETYPEARIIDIFEDPTLLNSVALSSGSAQPLPGAQSCSFDGIFLKCAASLRGQDALDLLTKVKQSGEFSNGMLHFPITSLDAICLPHPRLCVEAEGAFHYRMGHVSTFVIRKSEAPELFRF